MSKLSSTQEQLLGKLLSRRLTAPTTWDVPRLPAGERVPLSASQAGLWFLQQLYPDSSEYSVFEWLRLEVAPEEAQLDAAVRALLGRHDALRLRIFEVAGEPFQEDAGPFPPPVVWHDLSDRSPDKADAEALELAVAATREIFRLDEPPLWRVTAVRLPEGDALLVLVVHHLVADHWSWQLLLHDLTDLLAGNDLPPHEGVRFLDYTAWERSTADTDKRLRELDYWMHKLGGELPVLQLPTDRPLPTSPTRNGHTEPITVPAAVVERARGIAAQEGTTPFAVFLAAYKAFLARVTGQTDVLVGTALAGRDHPSTERLVGCFVKLVPLRTVVDLRGSYRETVRRVHRTVVEAQDNQSISYQEVVAQLNVPRDLAGHPVVQTFFGMQAEESTGFPGAEIGPAELTVQNGTGRWDLAITLTETPDGVSGYASCLADLFDASTLGRLVEVFVDCLDVVTARPDVALRAHPLVPPSERDRVLSRLNAYERPGHPCTTLAQPFEAQAARTPGSVALEAEDGTLTYGALNELSNQIGHFLRGEGAGRGERVALCMERSIDMMIALYGVVKSGATYVPLDPDLPDGRLAFALEDTDPLVVLTDTQSRPRVPAGPWRVVNVEDDSRWCDLDVTDLDNDGPTNHISHLLYTSGSTGRPKAVACLVESAVADILSMQDRYPYAPSDVTIFKTSYGFDTSLWEIFWPLWFGAKVVVCEPGAQGDPDRLGELIDRHRVTALYLTPTLLQAFVDSRAAGSCGSLRRVFSGGEPVTPRLRDAFYRTLDAILVNGYGPTETGCAVDIVVPDEPGAPVVPVGRPHANFRPYILDENLHVLPIGVAGEAYLGAEVGINAGYFRRPALTAERFLPDPFGPAGSRMYRTGDICRFRPDGVLEILGRADRQVKIRGMRIELAEVEAVISEHEAVDQCVALAVVKGGAPHIVAFAQRRPGTDVASQTLREHAAQVLPGYMMPSSIQLINQLPVTVNGKVDSTALLAFWHGNVAAESQEVVEPETELEAGLTAIFARLLGTAVVGVTDSFFELGGHSLLIFRLIAACEEELAVAPTVTDVFNAPTVRELAALLQQR